MKRTFFQATSLAVVSAIALPLFAQPARADDSVILRCAPSFDRCAVATSYVIEDASDENRAKRLGAVYSSDSAGVTNGATRHVAQLGDRYVFEGSRDFSRQRSYEASTGGFRPESFNLHSVGAYSAFLRVGGIAGASDALTFAPDGERPYAQKRYSPLVNTQALSADNAPRIIDFAMFAAREANPAGFLVNYPDVVRIIRL
jgi:hypothetical protein